MNIKINCHSSICVNDEIWFDPFRISDKGKAKYIFITHSHFDHFSVDDIKKLLTNETKIICPLSMKYDVENLFDNEVVFVEPERVYKLDNLEFETFHSYNINKQFHPKSNNWIGYNLKTNNEKIAVIGDSDNTPELNKIKTDILLVPIGGTYTMTVQEAANLTNNIKPKKVIPTHYGEIVGEKSFGKDFEKMIDKDIVCELLI
ncbi:MAG: MBL fold metallo-hydrolase [Clostridia bacterium]|nr:MBL fold metallo-hydrolase [Clostridia bacterium]